MILKPWEVEYVVAPVHRETGAVGLVSEPFKMPVPAYPANRVLPPVPHATDSFEAQVRLIANDSADGVRGGTYIVPTDPESPDPDTGRIQRNEFPVIRPWDHVYIKRDQNGRGIGTLPRGTRGAGWNEGALKDDTFTVGAVVTGLLNTRGGADEAVGIGFEIVELARLGARLGLDLTAKAPVDAAEARRRGDGAFLIVARMEKDARGKLFPSQGYRISWPWAERGPHADVDHWAVWRRDHTTFGFVGTTSTTTGQGNSRRAVFEDEGIPPDLSYTPPFRRPEGEAYSINSLGVRTGWPGVSARYAQRFVLSGYQDSPGELKFASPGRELDFRVSTPGQDTDSFVRELASRYGAEVRHAVESSGLLILTSGGEWSVASTGGAFTPSNTAAQAVGYIGCSNVAPIEVDNQIVFANRASTRIYAVTQEQELGRLDVQELTTLAQDLFEGDGIRAMAYSAEERVLFIALKSRLVSLTYIPEAGIVAFATHGVDFSTYQPDRGFETYTVDVDCPPFPQVRNDVGFPPSPNVRSISPPGRRPLTFTTDMRLRLTNRRNGSVVPVTLTRPAPRERFVLRVASSVSALGNAPELAFTTEELLALPASANGDILSAANSLSFAGGSGLGEVRVGWRTARVSGTLALALGTGPNAPIELLFTVANARGSSNSEFLSVSVSCTEERQRRRTGPPPPPVVPENTVLEYEDLTFVRRYYDSVSRHVDVLYVVARERNTLTNAVGAPSVLVMPMHTVRDTLRPDRIRDNQGRTDAEGFPVRARLETFSFSPRTRHGRDEGDDPAYASEALEALAYPFVEADVAACRVWLAEAGTVRDVESWPVEAEMQSCSAEVRGATLMTKNPCVHVEYDGNERGEIYGVGVTTGSDDTTESGLPRLHIDGTLCWIASNHQAILTRDTRTGTLVNLSEHFEEVLTRGGRAIADWAWAPQSKLLALALTDGMLALLTKTDKGFAYTEHFLRDGAVKSVAVVRGADRRGDDSELTTEVLYMTAQHRNRDFGLVTLRTMALWPQASSRDDLRNTLRADTLPDGRVRAFPSYLETFPLVPPDAYDVLARQRSPDQALVESYMDEPYPGEAFWGTTVPHGYGDASLATQVEADGSGVEPRAPENVRFQAGGPYFVFGEREGGVRAELREGRHRTVVATAPYHEDTDYSMTVGYTPDDDDPREPALVDIHAVALRFTEEGNPLAALKSALETV